MTDMKANELMIGDWAFSENIPCKVFSIWERGIGVKNIDMGYEAEGVLCLMELSSIPLTIEILEKNGFIYRDLPFELYWEYDGVTIDCGACDYYYINLGNNRSMDVSDVHKLQHALRLCGLNDLANNFKV